MNRADCLAFVKAAPVAPIPFKRPDDGVNNVYVIKRHKAKVPFASLPQPTPPAAPLSFGDISAAAVDTLDLRRACPVRWMTFCHRNFRHAGEVEVFFDVDDKTARNWWEGKHAPASPFVIKAIACFPSALPILLGAA